MKKTNIAILGSGTVGGGVAKILLETKKDLEIKSGSQINLVKIVELFPKAASNKFEIPLNYFCGNGFDLTKEQADKHIKEIINSKDIDIVVETIGGTSDYLYNTIIDLLKSKKHIVTANKAMLAERGKDIYQTAKKNNVTINYEAAVCGAIPIIKAIKESFTGDEIVSISGIMNGTSNYILTKMKNENLSFKEALKLAQNKGYAEADPALDINGFDAGHKLAILIKLAYGITVDFDKLIKTGIEKIEKEDMDFAKEMDCVIKLICFAEKKDNNIYAEVTPMMVKNDNILSKVEGSTNAILLNNKYSGRHMMMGKGAGSLETASSIVADIIFTARYPLNKNDLDAINDYQMLDLKHYTFPFCIIFATEDIPGITGLVTTAIGNQNINIDTVSHNRHGKEKALFSIAVMPCTFNQINEVIKEIRQKKPDVLLKQPKIIPILY
ncbi:MAG: homoserine dehydrogenase [Spirochaetes bacterium]|nr:homoserine dehydrogenase [Spirochaetota bacterium]